MIPLVHSRAVKTPDRVLGVASVLELDEREARRVARQPHAAQVAVLAETVLQVVPSRTLAQVSHIYLTFQVYIAGRHGEYLK